MAEITTDKPQQTAKSKGLSDRQKDIIQKFAAVGSLIILAAIFSVTSSAFMTVNNAMTIALQVTSIALLGIGATYVIITGGIDLSVGWFWRLPVLWPRLRSRSCRCRSRLPCCSAY
jgi:ribose transport system permease protein